DQPTRGVPVVSDLTPTRTLALTADVSGITDGDGLTNGNNFRYQWQMSAGLGFVNIAGATAATFIPTQATVERQLRVIVTVTDDEGNPSVTLTSAPTQLVGNLLTGNNGANTLFGTSGSDYIDGGAGNDTLLGLAGDDVLIGGTGNDDLDGGEGADQMAGGVGNDTYHVDNAGDVITEGANAGTDLVEVTAASYVMADNLENLTYTGTGNFNGTGNALANTMTGGRGNDTLNGMDGDDTLFGLAGNDTLIGGNGNDSLDGGQGADAMTGGLGNDLYTVDNAGDTVVEGVNGGTDTVRVSLNTFTLSQDVEVLTFTGNGGFTGTGNALANTITGGTGVDRLNGAGGNDTLTGAGGNDVFIFGASFGQDIITDFDSNAVGGQDVINLAGRGLTAGNYLNSISVTANGTSTVLSFASGERITLLNTAVSSITGTDFQFS
ncbi:MAG TPA: heme peroxidase, partial [Leclercia sp.]|nr:heme peroxidase [Leclercia sp.]